MSLGRQPGRSKASGYTDVGPTSTACDFVPPPNPSFSSDVMSPFFFSAPPATRGYEITGVSGRVESFCGCSFNSICSGRFFYELVTRSLRRASSPFRFAPLVLHPPTMTEKQVILSRLAIPASLFYRNSLPHVAHRARYHGDSAGRM